MALPPDDLPRSPSGRIPRWVADEAHGHYGPHGSPRDWGQYSGHNPKDFYAQHPPRPTMHGPPVFRPYVSGMPPGLSRRQQRKWHKRQRKARNYRPRRSVGARITAFVLIAGLLTLGGLRLFTYPGGAAAAWDDLYSALMADPLGTRLPKDGPPLAEPPVIENPSDAYEFWSVERSKNGAEIPTRWSSCEAIRYVVNPLHGDEHFIDWVKYTVDEVSAATGLVFEFEGITDQKPKPQTPFDFSEREEWPAVVIQFASEEQVPDLEGSVAGLALVRQVENTFTGVSRYVSGNIYLDVTLRSDPPINSEPAYVHVLRHELGHLVGLGHIDDKTQLMYDTPTTNVFQDGDLTGLSKLGGGPCR